jgi:TetR/AcrR family transcriptional regulator, transcriptional repressor of aconitase
MLISLAASCSCSCRRADRRTLVRSGEIDGGSRPSGWPPAAKQNGFPFSVFLSSPPSPVLVKSGQPFYIDLMPRVSDEHLERRRRQIMDAALRCFARKGFHETTLQDVFRESGLSAGAVYRYFKSKSDLVQAITAEETAPIIAIMDLALAKDPVPGVDEIAGRLAAAAQELSGPDGPARVAPWAWAEALHDPAVADIVRGTWAKARSGWVKAAQRMRDDGRLPPGTDADAVGAALFSVLPGFLLQQLILGGPDAATLQRGLRQLLRPELLSPPDAPAQRKEEPGAGPRASTTAPDRETRTAAARKDTGGARQERS